jgi:CheY-like chemotaxis protein
VILIVEDHSDSADLLLRLLKRFGYDVRCATTAVAALDALKEFPIRLAIVDYNLPDHDGMWLLRQINGDESLSAVRTFFLSATFEGDVARRAFAEGAGDWLVKGVHSVSRIIETVERLYRPTPP